MKKKYLFCFLFLIIGLTVFGRTYTVLAKTTNSIMGVYNNPSKKISSKVKFPASPVASEQTRYAAKIPALELEAHLVEAEKAIAFLIEEHNRRVDMITMQEEYVKNLQAEKVKKSFTKLLDSADACNERQLTPLWGRDYSENEYWPNIPLKQIKNEDKWSNYPTLKGRYWTTAFSRYVLGTYTRYLNDAKASQGIWKGHPFDPITLDCQDWEKSPKDSGKYGICNAAEKKGLLIGSKNLEKFSNLEGLLDLIKNNYTTGRIPSTFNSCNDRSDNENTCTSHFDSIFQIDRNNNDVPRAIDGFITYWAQSNKTMQKYRKARWLVGYQFLMDVYHNEKFGPLSNRHIWLWPDQKTRYQNEILDNYYADVEEHYSHDIGDVDRPKWKPEYYDYKTHIPGGSFYKAISDYLAKWEVIAHTYPNMIYENCCNGNNCGEDGISCCEVRPLVHENTPSKYHSKDAPRTATCPRSVPPHTNFPGHPQTVPHPLIWNNGSPSVVESVHIDADPSEAGGYSVIYKIDTMEGETPLRSNGTTDFAVLALPNVWHNQERKSFDAGSVYGPYSRWTPINGTYYQPSYGPANKFVVKRLPNQLPQIFSASNLPINQNRIQVYLDIYEAYVHAVDANTYATNENKKLQKSLDNLLKEVHNNYANNLYAIKVTSSDKAAQPNISSMHFSGSISDADSVSQLLDESISRANYFYQKAKLIADEITTTIVESEYMYDKSVEWKEAYKKWKNKTVTESINYTGYNLEGEGPKVTGKNDSAEDALLTRLARVYNAILYFGGGKNIAGESVTYKPDPSTMRKALAGEYNADLIGQSRSKIERLKIDNSFVTPQKINTSWTGETSRENMPVYRGIDFEQPKSAHQHIGLWSDISKKMIGMKIGTIKDGDVTKILRDIDNSRRERLANFSKLTENRGEWATRLDNELKSAGNPDSFLTKWNFDSNTCLLKRRDSTK